MTKWKAVARLFGRGGVTHSMARTVTFPESFGHSWGSNIALVLATTLVMAAAGLFVLPPPALADLSRVPDDTVEANDRVSSIVRVGDRVYLGGSFTELKSPDGRTFARNRLAAIDANTGEVVADWNPDANGSVRTMVLSPDGSRLYIGGGFTNVGGLVRNRSAAIDLAGGSVDGRWTAGTNSTVSAMAVSESGVFLGGNFTTVRQQPRMRLAKVDGVTGALDPDWTPSADHTNSTYGSVRALEFSEDNSRLYAGGYFRSISGQQTGNLVALDPITGAVDGGFRPGDANGILCLAVSGDQVFVGTVDHLEGIEAFNAQTGFRNWYLGYGDHSPGTGDVQAMTVRGGTLYAGGHFDKMHDQPSHRLVAVDTVTGQVDPQWTPNVTSRNGAVWAMTSYGPHLYVGGVFSRISGQIQE